MATVRNFLENHKYQMDVGAFYFEYQNGEVEAIHKDVYDSVEEDRTVDPVVNVTYYKDLITSKITKYGLRRWYYKCNKGWTDMVRLLSISQINAVAYAFPHYEEFKVPITNLKATKYIDQDFKVYDITACDGYEPDVLSKRESMLIDFYEGDISYEVVKFADPDEHKQWLKRDLKVTLNNGHTAENILVWFNGVFVDIHRDATFDNIFYIINAMDHMTTEWNSFKPGDPMETEADFATIIEDEDRRDYRYTLDMKIFKWRQVGISEYNIPMNSDNESISYDDPDNPTVGVQVVNFPKLLDFGKDINKDAHLIISNGRILNRSEYVLDPDNPRRIHLTQVRFETLMMLEDLISKDIPKPMEYIRDAIAKRNYQLVNFSSLSDKDIFMRDDINMVPNFPMIGQMVIPGLDLSDLIIVDGYLVPHIWVGDNIIEYPKTSYKSNYSDFDYLNKAVIRRLTFFDKSAFPEYRA